MVANGRILKQYDAPARVPQLLETGNAIAQGPPSLQGPGHGSRSVVYPSAYNGIRELTGYIQDVRNPDCKKKRAPKPSAVPDSDDEDIEVIIGKFSKGLLAMLTRAMSQMEVDDVAKPAAEPGIIPKGLNFKKNKLEQPAPVAGPSKKGKEPKHKKRKLQEDADHPKLRDDNNNEFIAAVFEELGFGKNISEFLAEAKIVLASATDIPDDIPAIRKRLFMHMADMAIINHRIHADVTLRADLVEAAASLAAHLAELEAVAAA
ncbi:hypothetical protein FB45DRAFT_859310 [Roridomyces roridus]|uniref:Uncharacterized protein n=1 Tax=Roridomyces roridus TaxID=1738132 RepID=A0AAD7CJN7_9AGAR|nr:hypothetical protein FB45DRAFT_859310 [Roridomyces roridus]